MEAEKKSKAEAEKKTESEKKSREEAEKFGAVLKVQYEKDKGGSDGEKTGNPSTGTSGSETQATAQVEAKKKFVADPKAEAAKKTEAMKGTGAVLPKK